MTDESNSSRGSRPGWVAPAGACDTHIHFYGPPDRYPLASTATFQPPLAMLEQYRSVQQRLGLERMVVVQPSGYGFDNRCLLDAIQTVGDSARGVVVVDAGVTDEHLEQMHDAGVRGVRFFMFPGGVLSWSSLDEMDARANALGWHINLQLDGRSLPDHIERLRRLTSQLVIDHTGKFIEPVDITDRAFKTLLELVDRGKCWVKLAAPYETSRDGPPHYQDVGRLARALVNAAPQRILWASNWPHPSAQENPPDDAVLLDLLLEWTEDEAICKRILVDNPAHLYGFGPSK